MVTEDANQVSKIKEVLKLKNWGFSKPRFYYDGMKIWKKFGGTIEFPRFIKFKVGT